MFEITPWDRMKRSALGQKTNNLTPKNELSSILDTFFGNLQNQLTIPAGWDDVKLLSPAVDIVENEKCFRLEIELPGMTSDDVDISVDGSYITIKGEKETSKDEDEENYVSRERFYGHYRRTFAIPDNADADNITANFENGVLTLEIPKNEEARKHNRKIEIT